jgi:U6 snRNA phosphodiesterase
MLQTRLLVDYDSEDGSEGSGVSTGGNEENCATFQPLVVKRFVHFHNTSQNHLSTDRKLPALSTTLTGTAHTDDPSLHQGRTRTRPHVDGQWAAHVYVCLRLHRSAKDMISRIVADAMMRVQELQPLSDVERGELHVSLTRPIYLLEHQRRDLVQEVSRIARCTQPSVSCSKDESLFIKRNPASFSFKMSCSTVSSFQNDERTRVFLALNVGAGHTEVRNP